MFSRLDEEAAVARVEQCLMKERWEREMLDDDYRPRRSRENREKVNRGGIICFVDSDPCGRMLW